MGSNDASSVYFWIFPDALGQIPIEISAQTPVAGDAVKVMLLVKVIVTLLKIVSGYRSRFSKFDHNTRSLYFVTAPLLICSCSFVPLNDWCFLCSLREFSNNIALQHSSNFLQPDQPIICHCQFLFLRPERWFQALNILKWQSLVGTALFFFINRLRSA